MCCNRRRDLFMLYVSIEKNNKLKKQVYDD